MKGTQLFSHLFQVLQTENRGSAHFARWCEVKIEKKMDLAIQIAFCVIWMEDFQRDKVNAQRDIQLLFPDAKKQNRKTKQKWPQTEYSTVDWGFKECYGFLVGGLLYL